MTIYAEWHDFVTYPLDPERVKTEQQRLDTTGKVPAGSANYRVEEGGIMTKDMLVLEGDELEAMRVHADGGVTLWTKKWVFTLHRDRGMEKSFCMPRHPTER